MIVKDVIIIGAGPIGIACGVACQQKNLKHLILEKGVLTDALYRLPHQATFFSTTERLEIASIPFLDKGHKPSKQELLTYYKRVSESFDLQFCFNEKVTQVLKDQHTFVVKTASGKMYRSEYVIVAIGLYDCPNMLGIKGEGLKFVSHYYRGPHFYYGKKILIVGGANSAVEAALECFRYGSKKVTLVHYKEELHSRIKYWLKPDLLNRVKEGSIDLHLSTKIISLEKEKEVVCWDQKKETSFCLTVDEVLLLTGYHGDYEMLEKMGIDLRGASKRPSYDKKSMQSNVKGLYLAGVIAAGIHETGSIFIENGREHAQKIIQAIVTSKKERSY